MPQHTEQHKVKVSVNDIIIKAVALALRNVPEANGKFFGICFFELTQRFHDVNLCIV